MKNLKNVVVPMKNCKDCEVKEDTDKGTGAVILGAVIGSLFGPIGVVIGAIVGLLAWMVYLRYEK